MENELISKLRYVIYARKSTEDAEKQVRSINDQVADCQKVADEFRLNVVDVITEEKSAKIPNNRPKFSKLLRDINDRKVDGIISWHPDRLARNMVEAGKIIHKLDIGVIKDLRFKTFQFSNDANGKMMLGMLFVFAKHYSDDLKTKVDRGMQNNLKEGKSSGTPKHGYIREDDGRYRPDERNFSLLQQAWQKRAEGATLEDVAEFLNSNNYSKYVKRYRDYVPRKISKSTLGEMFNDTFYFGLLNQTNQSVDLTEIYSFEPMISRDTFYRVQSLSQASTRNTSKERFIYYPLRKMLFCSVCNDKRPFIVSRSKGRQGKYYLYYRCANKACTRTDKNIRGKAIFEQLSLIIEAHLNNLPTEAYAHYMTELAALSDTKKIKLRQQRSTAITILRGHKTRENDLTLSLGRAQGTRAIEGINHQLEGLALDIERQEAMIKRIDETLALSDLPPLTPEEFASEVKQIGKKLSRATGVQKDLIAKNLFLKLEIGEKHVTDYHWCEPFATLVKMDEIKNGGAYRIRTDHLFHAMEALYQMS